MGATIRVGIGGWNYAPWRSNFYPPKWPQKHELEFASRQLTSIEINSTYYSPQKPPTYARWRSQTPAGFMFSLRRRDFAPSGARSPTQARRSMVSSSADSRNSAIGSVRSIGNCRRTRPSIAPT